MTETVITGVDYQDFIEVVVVTGNDYVIELEADRTLVVEQPVGNPLIVEVPVSDIVVEATTGEKGPAPKFLSGTAPSAGDGTPGDIYIIDTTGTTPGNLYQKTESGWGSPITNIRGAAGIINTVNGKTGSSVVIGANDITTGVLPIAQVPTGTTATTVALGNHNHDSSYVALTGNQSISGAKTFTGPVVADVGSGSLSIKPGPMADHTYMQIFARSATPNTRSAYFGVGSSASTLLTIANEMSGGGISLTTTGGSISLNSPTTVNGTLHVTSTFRVGSTATAGYVLTADGSGNASWQQGQDPIPLGTTAQYYRGDKTWQTLNAAAVGLGNVSNAAQVDLTSAQSISGQKSFTGDTYVNRLRSNAKILSQTDSTLSGTANTALITRQHTHVGQTNTFHILDMMHRRASGTDWITTQLYQGIGIDTSFLDSPVNGTSKLKTWVLRDPQNSLVSFGDSGNTFLTLTNTAITAGPSAIFTGNGSGLTTLSASNVSSGTLAIARIPTGSTASTVALGDHNHDASYVSLSDTQTIGGIKTFSASPVVPDSSFSIAKTTGLQSALDGKAPSNSPTLTGSVTANVTSPVVMSNTTTGQGTNAASLTIQGESTTPAIYFKKITSGTTDGKLQFNTTNGRFEFVTSTSGAYRDVQALTFHGSGSGLTALDASNLSTGTVPQAALKPNSQTFPFTTGNEARPTGTTHVLWIGPVDPVNATVNDTFINTGV